MRTLIAALAAIAISASIAHAGMTGSFGVKPCPSGQIFGYGNADGSVIVYDETETTPTIYFSDGSKKVFSENETASWRLENHEDTDPYPDESPTGDILVIGEDLFMGGCYPD